MGYCSVLKRKEISDTCYDMDETWRHHAKWNKPVTKGQILCDFTVSEYNEVTRVVKLIQTERKRVAATSGEWGIIV